MDDLYDDKLLEAIRIIHKYKTPDACKNEQELNELEDAYNFIINDMQLHNSAIRTCEGDA